jgi:hypothetical protein
MGIKNNGIDSFYFIKDSNEIKITYMEKTDHTCQDQMAHFIFRSLKILFFMTFQITISKTTKEFLLQRVTQLYWCDKKL